MTLLDSIPWPRARKTPRSQGSDGRTRHGNDDGQDIPLATLPTQSQTREPRHQPSHQSKPLLPSPIMADGPDVSTMTDSTKTDSTKTDSTRTGSTKTDGHASSNRPETASQRTPPNCPSVSQVSNVPNFSYPTRLGRGLTKSETDTSILAGRRTDAYVPTKNDTPARRKKRLSLTGQDHTRDRSRDRGPHKDNSHEQPDEPHVNHARGNHKQHHVRGRPDRDAPFHASALVLGGHDPAERPLDSGALFYWAQPNTTGKTMDQAKHEHKQTSHPTEHQTKHEQASQQTKHAQDNQDNHEKTRHQTKQEQKPGHMVCQSGTMQSKTSVDSRHPQERMDGGATGEEPTNARKPDRQVHRRLFPDRQVQDRGGPESRAYDRAHSLASTRRPAWTTADQARPTDKLPAVQGTLRSLVVTKIRSRRGSHESDRVRPRTAGEMTPPVTSFPRHETSTVHSPGTVHEASGPCGGGNHFRPTTTTTITAQGESHKRRARRPPVSFDPVRLGLRSTSEPTPQRHTPAKASLVRSESSPSLGGSLPSPLPVQQQHDTSIVEAASMSSPPNLHPSSTFDPATFHPANFKIRRKASAGTLDLDPTLLRPTTANTRTTATVTTATTATTTIPFPVPSTHSVTRKTSLSRRWLAQVKSVLGTTHDHRHDGPSPGHASEHRHGPDTTGARHEHRHGLPTAGAEEGLRRRRFWPHRRTTSTSVPPISLPLPSDEADAAARRYVSDPLH